MRSLISRVLIVACSLAFLLSLGSGVASAYDPFVGKTYADASAGIAKRNGTPVVATVSGSALALDDCVVTSWARSNFLDSNGDNRRKNEYRLNLNCNNPIASPGHPGNSATTPEGIKAKKEQKSAATINKNPEWCKKNEKNMQYCVGLCNRTGLCDVEA